MQANTTILDQAKHLKLELSRDLPRFHDAPPVPLSHTELVILTPNRVQATLLAASIKPE